MKIDRKNIEYTIASIVSLFAFVLKITSLTISSLYNMHPDGSTLFHIKLIKKESGIKRG